MIYLENRFRHPNQSNPKSMDAVFVRTIGVREYNACTLHTQIHTPVPCPNSAEKNLAKTVHFLSLRTMLVTESDCLPENGKLLFPTSETQPHPFPPGSFWAFFLIKNVREKTRLSTVPLMKTIGLLRTQTLRENDGPIGIPIDDALRQETLPVCFFLEDTPFAMQSNAKTDQCVETILRWNWPK